MNQILKTLIFFVALKDPVASSVQIGDPGPTEGFVLGCSSDSA